MQLKGVLLIALCSFMMGYMLAVNEFWQQIMIVPGTYPGDAGYYYSRFPNTNSWQSRGKLLSHLPHCSLPQSTMTLSELANKYRPSKFYKYSHTNYDRFYPDYFELYRSKRFKMLEIGLDTGNGTLLWEEYFPCAELVGLELERNNTKTSGAQSIKTILGDQGDRKFLETDFMKQSKGGGFDIIIDDGGHHYEQQRTSYEILFDKALNPGGLYIIEDIETSYWQPGTTLYGKSLTRGGCGVTGDDDDVIGDDDGPGTTSNTLMNEFKKMLDVVNKKFFDNTYYVFGPVDQLVASVTFASNLIVLRKKDKSHCRSEKLYLWPKRLADDCPAKHQNNANILMGSPMHKLCGDGILQIDQALF